MKTKLIIAGIGNIIDAVATFILTQYFGFVELNPVVGLLLQHPMFFVSIKIIVVNSILLYAYHTKNDKYVDTFATFTASLYGGIGMYYILWFLILF